MDVATTSITFENIFFSDLAASSSWIAFQASVAAFAPKCGLPREDLDHIFISCPSLFIVWQSLQAELGEALNNVTMWLARWVTKG